MSSLLLDTQALLWIIDGSSRLSDAASSEFRSPSNKLFLSHAAAWEIAIKVGAGKLSLPLSPREYLAKHLPINNITYLQIALPSIFVAGQLPRHHGDPFDRMMVAQCLTANTPIISSDAKLDAYGIRRVW